MLGKSALDAEAGSDSLADSKQICRGLHQGTKAQNSYLVLRSNPCKRILTLC